MTVAIPFSPATRAERPAPSHEAVFGHLLRISRALAGLLDLNAAIQAVSDELTDVLPHDHLDVCLLRAGERVHVAYEAGLHTDWSLAPHPLTIDKSPIRSLLLGEVPFLVTGDATQDPRFGFEGAFNHPIFDQKLRSRLHAPLLVRGEVIGAFSCSKHSSDFYREEDVAIARHVAEILAPYFYALRASEDARRLAIEEAEGRAREEGLREGALRLTEELERERQRIGMDLHDGTLADLTRIARRLEVARNAAGAGPSLLDPVVESLHRCMGDLRRIIDDARPNILELFGFAEGIEDFLSRALADTGIHWRLRDESEGVVDTLDSALRVALFRIVQEAVNNASQHASPSLIEVEITCAADALRILVRDDGIGFAPIQQRRRVGGVRNMQTRARLVSAAFFLDRLPEGRGTMMSLTLPLPDGGAA